MRIVLFFTLSLLVLFGCSSCLSGSTRFSNREIQLGATKASIIEKYGIPFKENMHIENGDTIEVLSYKEKLFINWNQYIVSTYFYFKNSELFKKEQMEERVEEETSKNINIKIDQK